MNQPPFKCFSTSTTHPLLKLTRSVLIVMKGDKEKRQRKMTNDKEKREKAVWPARGPARLARSYGVDGVSVLTAVVNSLFGIGSGSLLPWHGFFKVTCCQLSVLWFLLLHFQVVIWALIRDESP